MYPPHNPQEYKSECTIRYPCRSKDDTYCTHEWHNPVRCLNGLFPLSMQIKRWYLLHTWMTEPGKMFERAVCFTHGSPRSMFERQGACTSVATESSVADACSHATPRCQSCTPLLAASSACIRGKNRYIRYICLSTSPFYNYSGSTYMC